MTLEQLKAMAYDRIVLMQNTQMELEQINKAIREFGIQEPTETVEETVIDKPTEEEKPE